MLIIATQCIIFIHHIAQITRESPFLLFNGISVRTINYNDQLSPQGNRSERGSKMPFHSSNEPFLAIASAYPKKQEEHSESEACPCSPLSWKQWNVGNIVLQEMLLLFYTGCASNRVCCWCSEATFPCIYRQQQIGVLIPRVRCSCRSLVMRLGLFLSWPGSHFPILVSWTTGRSLLQMCVLTRIRTRVGRLCKRYTPRRTKSLR